MRWRCGNKVKRPFNWCKHLLEWQASGRGCVSFFFLQSFTSGWGQIISLWSNQRHLKAGRAGRVLWGRPWCVIIITEVAKDTDLAWKSQNWFLLITGLLCGSEKKLLDCTWASLEPSIGFSKKKKKVTDTSEWKKSPCPCREACTFPIAFSLFWNLSLP